MTYKYTKRNLLHEPERYMYSQYQGKELLVDYFASREDFISNAMKVTKENISKLQKEFFRLERGRLPTELIKFFQDDLLRWNIEFQEKPGDLYAGAPKLPDPANWQKVETLPTLFIVGHHILIADNEKSAQWLSFFIQRFEVTRRLFDEYKFPFTPAGEAAPPISYSLLALSCAVHFETTHNLKILNTALKLNDLLCSISDSLNIVELFLSGIANLQETKAVQKIMAQRKVII